jgi:hypothetical protein
VFGFAGSFVTYPTGRSSIRALASRLGWVGSWVPWRRKDSG